MPLESLKDKTLLEKAIDSSVLLNKTQKLILKLLVNYEVDEIVTTKHMEIAEQLGVANATVTASIRKLISQKILIRINGHKTGVKLYKFNDEELVNIIKMYQTRVMAK